MKQGEKKSRNLLGENNIRNLLFHTEGCILGIIVGMQLPKRYRKPIFICCAWLGFCISGVFLLYSFIEKVLAKKEDVEDEGFIMRIVEEE